MKTETEVPHSFQESDAVTKAGVVFAEFLKRNSFFFRHQLLIVIFVVALSISAAIFFGIKWFWVLVAYAIFHGFISIKTKNDLEFKFMKEHPTETILRHKR